MPMGSRAAMSECAVVVEDHRELRVEHGEHRRPYSLIERQDDLAVESLGRRIFWLSSFLTAAEAVQLAVADDGMSPCSVNGCMPVSSRPMMDEAVEAEIADRRCRQMRLMSGPRETVRENCWRTVS
jgi:hypothetical protein